MSEEKENIKPIQDQIFEEMMSEVRKNPDFNDEIVKNIETIYKSDGLKKSGKIIETIMPD